MAFASFNDLIAWQRSMDLAEEVYRATRDFPKTEQYGLTSQMRRAAVSIPSNIAEGRNRRTTREFVNFLFIARGSLGELETQVRLATRLAYFAEPVSTALLDLCAEVGRLMTGLAKSLAPNP